jgi:porin
MLYLFIFLLPFLALRAEEATYGMSGNPGAVDIRVGSGELGRRLHIPESSGVRLGGIWLGDYNALLSGRAGVHDDRIWTGNSSLILDLYIDCNAAFGWTGGSFGSEFLQFNGQPTNADAGVVQGYNSLPGDPPLNRSELYQLWVRQEFAHKHLSVRIGKTVPTYHFNNVSKPVPTEDLAVSIPSVTGVIYTPIFVNPTLLGAIGGYYNSVYGVVASVAPVRQAYINLAIYDGNVAKGVQTGLTGPHFNGYYFSIGEVGYGWTQSKPGIVALGGWYQSGLLKAEDQEQRGTGGVYAFGSQALWIRKSETSDKGNLSSFFQLGWNNSRTLEMDRFVGFGLTAFALSGKRPNDSFGAGLSWSRLNPALFDRRCEWMVQGYYQAQVYSFLFVQPVLSYIPNPGAHPTESNVVAFTGRMSLIF